MSSGRGRRPVDKAGVIPRTGKSVVGSFKDDLTDLNSQLEQIRKEKERQEKDFNQQVQTLRATLAHLVGTFTKEKAEAVAEAIKKYQLMEEEVKQLREENEALKKAAEKTMETDEANFSFETLQGEHLKEIDILKKVHEKEVKQLKEDKEVLKETVQKGEESLQKLKIEADEAKSYLEALQDQHHQEKELLKKSVKEGEEKAMVYEKEVDHLKETLQKKSVEADEAKSSLEAFQDQHRQETEALKKALKEERESLQKMTVEAEVLKTHLDSVKENVSRIEEIAKNQKNLFVEENESLVSKFKENPKANLEDQKKSAEEKALLNEKIRQLQAQMNEAGGLHLMEKEALTASVKEKEEHLQKIMAEAAEEKASLEALKTEIQKEKLKAAQEKENGHLLEEKLEQLKAQMKEAEAKYLNENQRLKNCVKEGEDLFQEMEKEAEKARLVLIAESEKKIKETEEKLRQELNYTLNYANATAWAAHNAKVAFKTEIDRLQMALKEAEAKNVEIKTKQSERRTAIYNENKDLRDKLDCKREQLASSEEKNRKLIHSLHLQLAIADRASRAASSGAPHASMPSGAPPPARTPSSAATRDPPTTSTPALKRPHPSQSTGAEKGGKRASNDDEKTGLPAKSPPDSSKEKEESTTERQPKRRGRPRKEEKRA